MERPRNPSSPSPAQGTPIPLQGKNFDVKSDKEHYPPEQNAWLNGMVVDSGDSKAFKATEAIPTSGSPPTESLVALRTLLPNSVKIKFAQMQNMPERTSEERASKEKFFRELVREQYQIKEVPPDRNEGLHAVIVGMIPVLEAPCEKELAAILRGDIADYAIQRQHRHDNPASAIAQDSPSDEDMKVYCEKVKNGEIPVGEFELKLLSEVLDVQIGVIRYTDAVLGWNDTVLPGRTCIFGKCGHEKKPIFLYYDPIHEHYMSLKPIDDQVAEIMRGSVLRMI